jgi:Uma2 family endonuclease
MVSELVRHRFTVEDMDRMIAAGILGEEDHVELIGGEIVEMAAKGEPHQMCLMRSNRYLHATIANDLWVSVQDPIVLAEDERPEPDLLVCRIEKPDESIIPTIENTLFVVEIAHSSLSIDRNMKLPRYGQAGIPESWLFDLVNKRIERHTEPGPGGYRLIAIAQRGESLPSTVVPGVVFVVDDLLR